MQVTTHYIISYCWVWEGNSMTHHCYSLLYSVLLCTHLFCAVLGHTTPSYPILPHPLPFHSCLSQPCQTIISCHIFLAIQSNRHLLHHSILHCRQMQCNLLGSWIWNLKQKDPQSIEVENNHLPRHNGL